MSKKLTSLNVRLGDYVENINSYYKADTDGELPYVAGPHIDAVYPKVVSYGSTADDDFPPTFKRKFQNKDILLHSRGVEKIAMVDRSGVTGEKLFVLRSTDTNLLSQDYLLLVLRSRYASDYFNNNISGSVNKFLNWTPLANFHFALPKKSRQDEIVKLFMLIDSHNDALDQLMINLLQSEKIVIRELIEDSGFDVLPLSYFANLERGVSYKTSDYTTEEFGRPFITLKSVSREGLYSAEGLKWVNSNFGGKRFASSGDLFIANTDLTPGRLLVGAPFYFPGVSHKFETVYSMDLTRIISKHEYLDNSYLYLALRSNRVRKYMVRNTRGSTVGHLDINSVLELGIPEMTEEAWLHLKDIAVKFENVRVAIINEKSRLLFLKNKLSDEFLGGPDDV